MDNRKIIKEFQKEVQNRREKGANINMIIDKERKINFFTEVNIGDRLRDLRKDNKFTQEDLAELLGLSRAAVNSWEMGLTLPSIQCLIKLSIIYRVSTDYLLGLDNSEIVDISNLKQSDKEIIYSLLRRLDDEK